MATNCLVSTTLIQADGLYEHLIYRICNVIYSKTIDNAATPYTRNTYLNILRELCGMSPKRDNNHIVPTTSEEPVSSVLDWYVRKISLCNDDISHRVNTTSTTHKTKYKPKTTDPQYPDPSVSAIEYAPKQIEKDDAIISN